METDRDILAQSIGEALIYEAVMKLARERLGMCVCEVGGRRSGRRCQSVGVFVPFLGRLVCMCPRHRELIGGKPS